MLLPMGTKRLIGRARALFFLTAVAILLCWLLLTDHSDRLARISDAIDFSRPLAPVQEQPDEGLREENDAVPEQDASIGIEPLEESPNNEPEPHSEKPPGEQFKEESMALLQ